MGSEIVYCSDCRRRLMESDFEKRKAYVIGVQTLCAECAAPILASLPPAQRESVLSRSGHLTAEQKPAPLPHARHTTTRTVASQTPPPPEDIPPSRFRRYLPFAAGGALLLIVILFLVFRRGGAPPAPVPPVVAENKGDPSSANPALSPGGTKKPGGEGAAPPPSMSPREASAKEALKKALEFEKANPNDVDGLTRLAQKAVGEAEETPVLAEARKYLEAVLTRQQAALEKELEALGAEVRALVEKRDFDAAVALLDAAAKRHETPLWSVPIDRKKAEVREASTMATPATPATPPVPVTPDVVAPPPTERRNPERREALAKQAPPGCRLACYLDCGPDTSDGVKDGPSFRLVNGKSHTFKGTEADAAGKCATIAFDERALVFEATGLAPAKAYLVGFDWWDGDQQGRAGSVWASDGAGGAESRLLDTVRLPGQKQKPDERLLAVPRAILAGGRLRLTFRNDGRPNIGVGEIWLWESEAEEADAAAILASMGGRGKAPVAVALPAGPPVLRSVLSSDPTRVELVFNKPLDPATGGRAESYVIAPRVTVSSCALEPGGRQVTLTTSPLAPGILYTVTVSGVKDADEGAVAPEAKRMFASLRLPVENLALWLRGDPPLDLDGDGAVRQWPDRSGKGSHAVQPNALSRPLWVEDGLNGRPVVRFDGQNDCLDVPGVTGAMGSFTLVFLLQPASRTNHNQSITAQGHWGQFSFHTTDAGGIYVGTSVQSRIAPEHGPGRNTLVLSTWQAFTYVFDNGKATLYRNGVKVASRTLDKPAPWTGFRLGLPDPNTLHGDLAELLLYSSALPDEGRRAVERYLHEKYFDPESGVPPLAVLTSEELKLSPELQRRHEEEVKRVLDGFTKDLSSGKTENERAVALWNVGSAKIRDPRIVAKVLPYLNMEGDLVRCEAAAALAGYVGDKTVAQALNTALNTNRARPRVVEKVVASIVAVAHESSVQPLEQMLRSGDPKNGALAARALGHYRTDDAFDALLGVYERVTAERAGMAQMGKDARKAVEERVKTLDPALQESLARLAGQKLPGCMEYRAWWKLNKAAFIAGQPTTPVVPASYVDPLAKMIPDAKGYELVYELNLERLAHDITYDRDNSASVKPFDRVAYLVELQPEGGASQFVWVSMDAFTDDPKKIGIPTVASGASFQTKVNNMVVVANCSTVTPGTFAEGGNIEFWPNNYGGQNGAKVPGASDDSFDFGDQITNPQDGYGSMQVHNYSAKQTVFSISHWREGARADLGIGSKPDKNSDWTFSGNANTYAVKKLRVFVRPRK